MLRFRSAPLPEKPFDRRDDPPVAVGPVPVAPAVAPSIRRALSRESGRALETLGHAIEYLADEYAASVQHAGGLGSADPRVEAIQILKRLNRAVYYSGTEMEPAMSRMRRWLTGAGTPDSRTR